MSQSENAENASHADTKTRKMQKLQLTGFNVTGFRCSPITCLTEGHSHSGRFGSLFFSSCSEMGEAEDASEAWGGGGGQGIERSSVTFQEPQKGINMKNLGRNPPSQTPPPLRDP